MHERLTIYVEEGSLTIAERAIAEGNFTTLSMFFRHIIALGLREYLKNASKS
jgi:hypothetical protein